MAEFKSKVGKQVFCAGIGVVVFKKETLLTDCEATIKAMKGAKGVIEVDGDKVPDTSSSEGELEAAREAYLVKFGEKPHGNTSLEKLLEAINASDE